MMHLILYTIIELKDVYHEHEIAGFEAKLQPTKQRTVPIKRAMITAHIHQPGNYSFYRKNPGEKHFEQIHNSMEQITQEQNRYWIRLEIKENGTTYVIIGATNNGDMVYGLLEQFAHNETTPVWSELYINDIPEYLQWAEKLFEVTIEEVYGCIVPNPVTITSERLQENNGQVSLSWKIPPNFNCIVTIGELLNGDLIRTSIKDVSGIGRFAETITKDELYEIDIQLGEISTVFIDDNIVYRVPVELQGYYYFYISTKDEESFRKTTGNTEMLGKVWQDEYFQLIPRKGLQIQFQIVAVCESSTGLFRTPIKTSIQLKKSYTQQEVSVVTQHLEWQQMFRVMISDEGSYNIYAQTVYDGDYVYIGDQMVRISSKTLEDGPVPCNWKLPAIYRNVIVIGELLNGTLIRTPTKNVSKIGRFKDNITIHEMERIKQELTLEFDDANSKCILHIRQTGYYKFYILYDDDTNDYYKAYGDAQMLGTEFGEKTAWLSFNANWEGYVVALCQTEDGIVRSQEFEIDQQHNMDVSDDEDPDDVNQLQAISRLLTLPSFLRFA